MSRLLDSHVGSKVNQLRTTSRLVVYVLSTTDWEVESATPSAVIGCEVIVCAWDVSPLADVSARLVLPPHQFWTVVSGWHVRGRHVMRPAFL